MKSGAAPHVRPAAILFAAILFCAIPLSPEQASPQPPAAISVGGEVGRPYVLSASELAALPHQSVTIATEKHGSQACQGVPVAALLQRAGAPLGPALRGRNMRLYVLVKARDGYAAVFALPEFDSGFTDRTILLIDRCQGHALDAFDGPLRVIVPGEKRHARWVRQVTEIDVISSK
jgi:DMSO/TMAO reductase YedYZ molybdopterin-dependent catalytic subunit